MCKKCRASRQEAARLIPREARQSTRRDSRGAPAPRAAGRAWTRARLIKVEQQSDERQSLMTWKFDDCPLQAQRRLGPLDCECEKAPHADQHERFRQSCSPCPRRARRARWHSLRHRADGFTAIGVRIGAQRAARKAVRPGYEGAIGVVAQRSHRIVVSDIAAHAVDARAEKVAAILD
jgi:hypothetical protein